MSAHENRIVVLADDLSGAAELAGITCRHSLTAEVQRRFEPATSAQVLCIDSDSRGLSESRAAARVTDLARQVAASRPAWIYKKVDSVLRGHPRAEIEAVMQVTGRRRAVLIAANPSRGRVICGGIYLVNGVRLDQTDFAHDPEYPRKSAAVTQLVAGTAEYPIHHTAADGPLPESGMIVPDVLDASHLRERAAEVDDVTLAAGAADFFSVLLERRCPGQPSSPIPAGIPPLVAPAILVCGSLVAWRRLGGECRAAGLPIVTLDEADKSSRQLESAGALVLAIGDLVPAAVSRAALLSRLAAAVERLLRESPVATLLVEGGATAAAVSERLGWSRFAVSACAPAGVGFLHPLDTATAPQVLMKPGSYAWPGEIWQAFCALRRA